MGKDNESGCGFSFFFLVILFIVTWNFILRTFIYGYLSLFLVQTVSFIGVIRAIALGIHYKTKSIYLNPFVSFAFFPASYIMIAIYLVTKDEFPFDFFVKDMIYGCWGFTIFPDWIEVCKGLFWGIPLLEKYPCINFSAIPLENYNAGFMDPNFIYGLTFYACGDSSTHFWVLLMSIWKFPYSIYAWIVLFKGFKMRRSIPKSQYMESQFYCIED